MRSKEVSVYAIDIVTRMFIDTADQNYIIARWSYFNSLNVDFWWMALHAVEKYLKSIHLLNGASAKGYGHDIDRLYRSARGLHKSFSIEGFVRPEGISDKFWSDESIDDFISRISATGDPNNRYMQYGYFSRASDIFKVDHVIWSVRRYCRPFFETFSPAIGEGFTIDWPEKLKCNPSEWRISSFNRLEQALDNEISKDVFDAISNLNFAFAPEYPHSRFRNFLSAGNAPFGGLFECMANTDASSTTRQEAKDAIQWFVENVQVGSGDHAAFQRALSEFDGNLDEAVEAK